MLTNSDIEHLKLLYGRFLKMNAHIKELILASRLDDADIAVQQKAILQKEITAFEKPRLNDIKNHNELNQTRLNLIKLEEENLKLVEEIKNALQKELCGVKKSHNLLKTYEPELKKTVSTFQVSDADE